MFSFTHEQKVLEVSGISLGGQPGLNPTVLFGGVFFKGDPDFEDARRHLFTAMALEKDTGVPVIPDFFIRKESLIEDIIGFIQKTIPRHHPFSVDIIDPAVKLMVLDYLREKKLLSRTIYNSLHIGTTKEEIQTLTEHPPAAAILVAFNPKDKSPDGKLEVLENGAHLTEKGLLALAQGIGIPSLLLDTAALAPGENSGAAIAAIPVLKEEYGLPTGCAIHNIVEKSIWLNEYPLEKKTVDVASNLSVPLFGGDFVIFGPLANVDSVVPLIAWQDIVISEYVENYFGVIPSASHPRRKLQR